MSVLIEVRPEAGPALIVGGGAVALRKARTLADGEFPFTVIAPQVVEAIHHLSLATVIERPFAPADVPGCPRWGLVLACTGDREVNQEVGRLARSAGIPVLVADRQAESTFFTPATVRDGDLTVGVSTGGASPSLARSVRERIITALGPGWGNLVEVARVEREERLAKRREARQ